MTSRRLSLIFILSFIVSLSALLSADPKESTSERAESEQMKGKLTNRNSQSATVIIDHFRNAPFPHSSRKDGWSYGKVTYPYKGHYDDDRIAIVIPAGFKPDEGNDYIVHFHGHLNDLARVLSHYRLPQQLQSAGRNAILICPQGPKKARDSGIGKIEEHNGFKRMVEEVVGYLYKRGYVKGTKIGRVILSAHSGGYRAVGKALAIGGLSEHVKEVWLFDASYGQLASYLHWVTTYQGRLVSFFTDHLRQENEQLKKYLLMSGLKPRMIEESDLTEETLRDYSPLFVHITWLMHDEVMQGKGYFRLMIETSQLSPIPSTQGH